MTLHLNEIARAVAPGAHALVLVDQAGWHQSKRLVVPANITLLPLPAKAPELNPVENVWPFMRENWLSNRIFEVDPGNGTSGLIGNGAVSVVVDGDDDEETETED
jgi:hypothetical protein